MAAGNEKPGQLHLEKTILRGHKALRPEQVILVCRVNISNPLAVANNVNGRFQSGETNFTIALKSIQARAPQVHDQQKTREAPQKTLYIHRLLLWRLKIACALFVILDRPPPKIVTGIHFLYLSFFAFFRKARYQVPPAFLPLHLFGQEANNEQAASA